MNEILIKTPYKYFINEGIHHFSKLGKSESRHEQNLVFHMLTVTSVAMWRLGLLP